MFVSTLGPLQVAVDGHVVALRRKERELLCALALRRGAVVSEDELIEALWNGSPPDSAANSLHVHVNRVRSALGATSIIRADGGYQLWTDAEFDVTRFETTVLDQGATHEQLAEVAMLWRGAPYSELAAWPPAVSAARHLVELRCLMEERIAEFDLASRGARFVVPELERLAQAEPLRERRWVLLASALSSDGRTVDALRTIQRAREALLETAGVDPGTDLVRLEQRLLAGEIEPSSEQTQVTNRVDAVVSETPVARRRTVAAVVALVALVAVGAVIAAVVWTVTRPRSDAADARSVAPASSETSASSSAATSATESPAPTATSPTTSPPTASTASSEVAAQSWPDSSDPDASLESVSCDDFAELAYAPTNAQGPRTSATTCAVLSVAERRGTDSTRTVRLHVVVEPGVSADTSPPVLSVGDVRNLTRSSPGDHIVLATRGLGGSDPMIDCPELVAPLATALGPTGPTRGGLLVGAQLCVDRLSAQGIDLAAYNSVGAADDIADLARLLDIDQLHLDAIGAFGTQVAQRLTERHGTLVASVLLQDTQPPGIALIDVVPATLARTWRTYVDDCESDPRCAAAYPSLDASWNKLTAALQVAPLDIQVSSGDQSPSTAVRVDGRLMQLALLYAFDIPASMPLIASFVTAQDADIIGRFASGVVLGSAASLGAGSGFRCTDESAYRNLPLADATQELAGSFGLIRDWLEMVEDICEVWPHDDPTPTAPPSNAPTLLIRGLLSPFLSQDWDTRTDRQWPAHIDLSLGTVTFGTDDRSPACLGEVIIAWWTDPSAVTPSDLADCAAQSPPIPFAGAS